jgi:hypothetical protein
LSIESLDARVYVNSDPRFVEINGRLSFLCFSHTEKHEQHFSRDFLFSQDRVWRHVAESDT